jgi:hypothetical protein
MLRRLVAVGLPMVLVSAALAATAQATTTSIRCPISFTDTTCPDPIALSGTLHEVVTTVENAGRTVRVRILDNPQGVTGVGLVSGRTHQGTAGKHDSFTTAKTETHTFNQQLPAHLSRARGVCHRAERGPHDRQRGRRSNGHA